MFIPHSRADQTISFFHFNVEVYLMNITCPYCHSENLSRVVNNQQQGTSGNSLSSMTCAGLGATLSKSLAAPFSPLVGGIAGAVVGGLLDSIFQPAPQRQVPTSYFYCHDCQRNFQ